METSLPCRRILVVEDNPLIAFDLDDALRERGFDVDGPALDLDSALELLRDDALDGAVLDIDFGGRPVWPVAHGLKDHGVPFMFVGADCGRGLPDDFTGAVCLQKPVGTADILTSVAAIVEQR